MTATQDAPVAKPDDLASPRLNALTGLRFVAAFLVFLDHAHWLAIFNDQTAAEDYSFLILNAGAVSVSFFFILTGFVLTWSARPNDTAPRLWRRRFFRVVPNHVVVYVAILAVLAMSGGPVEWTWVIAGFLLVDNWTADIDSAMYAVNGVTWSLSLDWAFYLLFPLLILGIRKIRPERLWRWAIGIIALVIALPAICQPFLSDQPWFEFYGMSWPELWFISGSPVRLLEFGLGMVLARMVMTGRWPSIPVWLPMLGILAAYIASLYIPRVWSFGAVFIIPMGLLIPAVAIREVKGRKSWLASPFMVWLGELSYAFYLVHFSLQFALHAALGGQLATVGTPYTGPTYSTFGVVLFVVGSLIVSVLVSWVIYVLIERPVMRRWSNPRRVRTR